MPSKREIELKKLRYEKTKLIKETKKELKNIRTELMEIESNGKPRQKKHTREEI